MMQHNARALYGLEITLLVLVTFTIRWIHIAHLPFDDEMFHILAGRSWAVEGSLRLADGAYTRASGFSMLVGYLFRLCGESLPVARLPALIGGVCWVLAVFLWVRAVANRAAAWISAGLLCVAPHAIELSQVSRFYTVHGCLFWLGAIGWFGLLTRPFALGRTVLLGVGTSLSFAVALHLQPITCIGLIGLLVWSLGIWGRRWLRAGHVRLRHLGWLCIAAGVIGMGILALQYTSVVTQMLELYRRTAYVSPAQDLLSYHRLLLGQYPTLWPMMPLAMLGAVATYPRVGTFCVSVFGVALLLHSTAGLKEERYIYYTMPFFFTIWGLVLAGLLPRLQGFVAQCVTRIVEAAGLPLRPRLQRVCQWGGLILVLLFCLASNNAFPRLLHTLKGQSYYFGLRPADWGAARVRLQPYVQQAAVVVTTNFTKATYYLGRFDFSLNTSFLAENGLREFAIDHRNGRPTVGSVESMRLLLACFPHGVFVGEVSEWRARGRMQEAAADFLESVAKPIDLPPQWNLVAYTWQRPEGPTPVECRLLPPGPSSAAISRLTPSTAP